MPLNEVARRYADNLFQTIVEETVRKREEDMAAIRSDYGRRGLIAAGVAAEAHVLVESIRVMAEGRKDSLLKAYEKAAIHLDEAIVQEITSEVTQFCVASQHIAVGSINQRIQHTAHGQDPSGLQNGIARQISSGVSAIISRLVRDLAIRRDEILLEEMNLRKAYAAGLGKKWDVFVCHASEDKTDFVSILADALATSGLSVWYDEFTLKVGDSLRRRIDDGLANSRYGIVVLCNNFFAKNWPQQELDGLMSQEIAGTKVILPVWHNISLEEVRSKSPMLSGLVAAKSNEGIDEVVRKLREAMSL